MLRTGPRGSVVRKFSTRDQIWRRAFDSGPNAPGVCRKYYEPVTGHEEYVMTYRGRLSPLVRPGYRRRTAEVLGGNPGARASRFRLPSLPGHVKRIN